MKTKILFIAVLCFFFLGLFSQTSGSIKGKVTDKKAGTTIPFASVYIELGGQKSGVATNADGEFHLKALPSGTYDLHVTCMGYSEYILTGVKVLPGRPTFLSDIPLSEASIVIGGKDGVTVISDRYVKKLIDPLDPIQKDLPAEDIEKMAGNRSIKDLARVVSPEVQIPDNGEGVIIRGARSGSSQYIIDGVKTENAPVVSVFAIKNFSVYTGGVPAPYGDLTGGVIIIETKSYFDFVARERAKEKLKEEMEEM